jgi:hypothetical protein
MKLILLTTLLTTATAFAPSLSTTRPTTHHYSAISALPNIKLPNPYKSLPWIQEREKIRTATQFEYETAAMFRELGLPVDAKYEDIKERTDELIELYANDIKKRIHVEVARDKIYMIRLKERMGGVRKSPIVEEGESSGDEDQGLSVMRRGFRIPLISGMIDYARSIYMPPDEAWMKRQSIIWGAATLFTLLNPPMVQGFSTINWVAAGGMMGYRGMPGMGEREPGYNPFRGKMMKMHQVQAMGIGMMAWVFARGIAEFIVTSSPAMMASRSCEWFKLAIVNGILMLQVLYVQTYQEEVDDTMTPFRER